MATFEELLGAAQHLAPSERIHLAHALWDTVPTEEWPLPGQEWIDEAQRRSAEYDVGNMTAAPWPEVRARARRKAGLDG
jgi:putative addiction module component (TIGR02574 family)